MRAPAKKTTFGRRHPPKTTTTAHKHQPQRPKKPHDAPRNPRKLYENPPGSLKKPKRPQEVPRTQASNMTKPQQTVQSPRKPQEAPRSPSKPEDHVTGRTIKNNSNKHRHKEWARLLRIYRMRYRAMMPNWPWSGWAYHLAEEGSGLEEKQRKWSSDIGRNWARNCGHKLGAGSGPHAGLLLQKIRESPFSGHEILAKKMGAKSGPRFYKQI